MGSPWHVGDGASTVDLMIDLLSCYLFLLLSAPRVKFGIGHRG